MFWGLSLWRIHWKLILWLGDRKKRKKICDHRVTYYDGWRIVSQLSLRQCMAVFIWGFLLQRRIQRVLQCLFPVYSRSDQQCYESHDSHALLNRMGVGSNRHWYHLHLAHKLENHLLNYAYTFISSSVFCILQYLRLSEIFSHKTQV